MNYPPVPAHILDVLRGYNAYQLAGDADCASPDRLDSAGALFLLFVRDGVVDRLTSFDSDDLESWADDPGTVNDVVSEIADGAPDVYTHTLWAEFVDLAAYQEDPTDLGADASDMEQCARVCLYVIAERLATALFEEVHPLYVEAVEAVRPEVPEAMGYTPFAITDDADVLCVQCVEDESNPVHVYGQNDGWRVDGWSHDGETDELTVCGHCGRVIVDDRTDD